MQIRAVSALSVKRLNGIIDGAAFPPSYLDLGRSLSHKPLDSVERLISVSQTPHRESIDCTQNWVERWALQLPNY